MKRFAFTVVLALFCAQSYAGYGSGQINRYFVDSAGVAYFGFTVQPSGTCSYFIEHLKFNATSPEGKNMLATLVAAKVADTSITVWYLDSSTPGANHTNGCTQATMAIVTGIGIQ